MQIEVGQSLKAEDVVRVMERLKYERGVPGRIYCDNGSEFVSGQMDQWPYANGVKIEFSRLGKPTDNAVVEGHALYGEVEVRRSKSTCQCRISCTEPVINFVFEGIT